MKRLFAFLLALVMALGMIPTAYATETEEPHVHIEELTMEETEPTVEEPVQVSEPAMAATSGTCGENVTWKLENGTLTISGTGAMTDYESQSDVPWYDYCGEILTLVIEHGVTGIGEDAFRGCRKMTKATIPDSVTRIGDFAFSKCGKLQSITIPDSVTSLGENCFDFCTGLTSVSIGKGLTSISFAAFGQCNSLESIVIPDNITVIEAYAFTVCNSLKSITIPKHVTMIDQYAFADCTALKEITFTGDAPWFGEEVFLGVTANAYYPGNNSTWTADVMHNYGGNLTWEVSESFCAHEACTEVPSKEPTCTESGNNRYLICDDCGTVLKADGITKTNVEAETIPALGHDYVAGEVVEPTYLTPGYTQYTCSRCGDAYQGDQKNALGLPTPVLNVKNDVETGKSVISWEACEESDSYEIYRATSKSGKYTKISTVKDATYTDTKATAGKTYYYKVKAICAENAKLSSKQSAYKSAKCLFAQPVAETSNNSSGYPVIKWKKITSAKKYDVYYKEMGKTTFKKLATTSSTSYTHSKATSGKYYEYQVRAYGTSTSYAGAFSEAVTGIRKLAKPAITVTVNNDAGTAKITWKKITGATGYELQVSVNNGEFAPIDATLTAKSTSYTDTGLTVGSTYTYRLCALSSNEEANSDYCAEKKATIKCGAPKLTVTNDENGKPVLTWNTVEGAATYEIQMATSSKGKYKKLTVVTDTTYTHTAAVGAKTYYYKVRAIDANGNAGAYSSVKSKLCKCAAPEITTVTTNSSGYPTIKWGKVSGAKKYEVYYATTKDGAYKKLTTTSSTSYTYTKAKMDTEYFFKIRAYGASTTSMSAYSEIVCAVRKLAQPSLTVTANQRDRFITLKWKAVSKAEFYELQCSINGGEYETIATGNILKYTDKYLEPGNKYTYRVRAISANEATSSDYCAAKSATIKVGKPTLSIKLEKGKPSLTWTEVEGAVKYQVYYATSKSGKYKLVKTTEDLNYIYTAAKKGKTCYFKVRAVDQNGTTGDYSSVKSIKSK